MLSMVEQKDFFMAKIDLKDAYLTVPIAEKFHCLLGFQDKQGEFLQFQTLSFGLCTAPCTFSKLTKPAIQFLRQIGIRIIIYLDDMLITAQTEESLAQDPSTVLWLFCALGFIINIPKCSIAPSKQVDFLGFTVDTSTMMVILPSAKMSGIQSEVS